MLVNSLNLFQITSLKKDIEGGDELVLQLRKQSSLDKEESIYVCDELNNEIMDLDVSLTKCFCTFEISSKFG